MRAHSPIEDAAPDLGFASFYYRRKPPRQRPSASPRNARGADHHLQLLGSKPSGRARGPAEGDPPVRDHPTNALRCQH